MDIIIDTVGEADLRTKDRLVESDEDDVEFEQIDAEPLNLLDPEELVAEEEEEEVKKKEKINPSKDVDLDEFEEEMGWKDAGMGRRKRRSKSKSKKDSLVKITEMVEELTPVERVLKKTVIKPGFEQLETVPAYDESKRQIQAQRRKERSMTKGKKWFNLPAPEMTPEIKHDLEVIQMRSALDPKRFYKKNDLSVLPKYFQIGKVVDSPTDYYSGRLTKKERKRTIVDELMADAEFSKFNKRKYKEIIDEKKKLHYKAHRHAKRLKRGKKK